MVERGQRLAMTRDDPAVTSGVTAILATRIERGGDRKVN